MSFISPSVALYDLLGCSFETQRTSSQTEESSHLIPLPALDFLETQREHSAQIRRLLSSALPPTISPEFLETSQPFWSVQRESAPPRASRQAPPPTLSSSAEYTSDKDDRIDTQTIRLSIDQEREVEILRSLCMSSKLIGGSSSVKEHLASLTHPHAEVDMDDEEEEDNAMPDPPSSTNPSLSENPHQRLIARVCSLLNELGNLDASAISYVCQQLQMSQWPDLELSEVAREFVTASQSKSHSSCFILNVLFPKVNHLTALASRALFSCLTSVANNHPTSVMENLVRPLVFGSVASSPLKNVQTELLVRLIKQSIFPKHPILISDFLVDLFTAVQPESWNDCLINLQSLIISLKPELPHGVSSAHKIASGLNQNFRPFTKSVKFAAMMVSLIGNYKKEFVEETQLLRSMLGACETSIAKVALKKLS